MFPFALVVLAVALTAQPRVLVAPSLMKIRPSSSVPAGVEPAPSIELHAARGECESMHVVIEAGNETLQGVRMSALPLRQGKQSIPLALMREAFIEVRTPSNTEGDAGRWPDALVPEIDPVVGERRNAFPFDVAPGERQPVLVEACVPVEAKPGRYETRLSLRHGETRHTMPVRLEVHRATIPATATFPATFGLAGRSVMLGHHGRNGPDEERRQLVDRYARLALRHRISLHTMTRIPSPANRRDDGRLEVDFTGWDMELGPFIRKEPRFSAIDLRIPDALARNDWPDFARSAASHVERLGWKGRLFAYVMDEPKPEQQAELIARLDALQSTGVDRLVTTSLDPSLEGRVEIWAPNLNCLAHKRRRGEFCRQEHDREEYRRREAQGDRLFWYQSCSSHGCDQGPFGDARDDYFRGWPSYMVDVDGPSARVMGWLAFVHDIDGELYFDTVHAYRRWAFTERQRIDPWDDLFAFGGNGDGTLFYPGRPDRIGGHTHIPVASLRLVHIRDGLEDLELLRLLASRGGPHEKQARTLARQIAPSLFDFSHDAGAYGRAHRTLLDELDRSTP